MYSVVIPCLYTLSLCLEIHLSERSRNAERWRPCAGIQQRSSRCVLQESHLLPATLISATTVLGMPGLAGQIS